VTLVKKTLFLKVNTLNCLLLLCHMMTICLFDFSVQSMAAYFSGTCCQVHRLPLMMLAIRLLVLVGSDVVILSDKFSKYIPVLPCHVYASDLYKKISSFFFGS